MFDRLMEKLGLSPKEESIAQTRENAKEVVERTFTPCATISDFLIQMKALHEQGLEECEIRFDHTENRFHQLAIRSIAAGIGAAVKEMGNESTLLRIRTGNSTNRICRKAIYEVIGPLMFESSSPIQLSVR